MLSRAQRAHFLHNYFQAFQAGELDTIQMNEETAALVSGVNALLAALPREYASPETYIEMILTGDFLFDEVGCVTFDSEEMSFSRKPGRFVYDMPSEDLDGYVIDAFKDPIESVTTNLNTGAGITVPTPIELRTPPGLATGVMGFLLTIAGADDSPGGQIDLSVIAPALSLSRLAGGAAPAYTTNYTFQLKNKGQRGRSAKTDTEALFLFVRQEDSKLYPYVGLVNDIVGPVINVNQAPANLNITARALTAAERISHYISRLSK